MKTVFKSPPAFFSADTHEGNPEIPKGKMRVHLVTFETIEVEGEDKADPESQIEYTILAALPSVIDPAKRKELKRLMRQLLQHLEANKGHLR